MLKLEVFLMAKIFLMLRRVAIRDVVRGIVIKENDIKYTYTHDLGELTTIVLNGLHSFMH